MINSAVRLVETEVSYITFKDHENPQSFRGNIFCSDMEF